MWVQVPPSPPNVKGALTMFVMVKHSPDLFKVTSCDNVPGRTHTIVTCRNLLTGEIKEVSSYCVQEVSEQEAFEFVKNNDEKQRKLLLEL